MTGIKEKEAERRKLAYMLSKILIKVKPTEKTMSDCFKEVAEELGYVNYRNVSNIYHDLKMTDPKRLDNFYNLKPTAINKQEFEVISKIIKEADLLSVSEIEFELDVTLRDYRTAKIGLSIEGEERFSIVIDDGKLVLNLNDKFLFAIDNEYAHEWIIYANLQFMKTYPEQKDDSAADLADLRIKEEKEHIFFDN